MISKVVPHYKVFRILENLCKVGMDFVYKAHDTRLECPVAKLKWRVDMRLHVLPILAFMMAGSVAVAQQSRNEITTAAAPAHDTRANSDTVTDVYAIGGQFERIVVLRFKYQTDLLAGLEAMVKQEKIRNAVILAGTGSVLNYSFHVVSNRTFPTKNIFVKDTTAPADLASMNGYVIDGRVHAHVTLTDADKAFGGHLERGTTVFTFAIVTIGVLKDAIDFRGVDDKTYR